jgi:signal transduction histidine kinase
VPDKNTFTIPRPKILLVDDRKENLLALNAILNGEGYELIEATSGESAFEKVVVHEFAAILLDVQMPGMNGFQTAKLIRTIAHAKSTPIIFVTAIHQTEAHAQIGYGVGAIDYLFKPIDIDILKAKLGILTDLYKKNYEVQKLMHLQHEEKARDIENKFLKEQVLARDEFLAMASHELKTPITPLNLQLESFLKMVRAGTINQVDNARLERMLETAHTQVERLSNTIDKLLDVSRFTSGKVEMNFEPVNVSELVKKTVASFDIQLKKLGCSYTIDAGDNIVAECDHFRIQQVLINILTNAMKYGPGQPIHILLASEKNKVILKIKDHGVGISREDHVRIFRRFERGVSSKNYGGLGLGLYISSEIVKHHQGSIFIESSLGNGASFIAQIPTAQNVFNN